LVILPIGLRLLVVSPVHSFQNKWTLTRVNTMPLSNNVPYRTESLHITRMTRNKAKYDSISWSVDYKNRYNPWPNGMNNNNYYCNWVRQETTSLLGSMVNSDYSTSIHERSSSSLCASSRDTFSNDNENEMDKKKQKKNRKLPIMKNPVAILRTLLTKIIAIKALYVARFSSLSKKAKIAVVMQLMILSLMFGASFKRLVDLRSISRGGNTSTQIVRVKPVEVPYSVFMDLVESNGKGHVPGKNPAIKVENLIIGRDKVGFQLLQDEEKHKMALSNAKLLDKNDVSIQNVKPRNVYAMKPNASPELLQFLRQNEIPFRAASTKGANAMASFARFGILMIYVLFLLRMYKTMAGGGSNDTPGKLATSRSSRIGNDQSLVKFNDIEGIDEAKFEVMELVDTLRNPGKYSILGARAPTGLLLEGPPGTGKTMLARACAATAGVPLLYCSGSDFVEMFVGRGAARVRKTFAKAAKLAPCIIFIDELDALGKSRANDMLGGISGVRSNDEAEQTLNQLLACMDGLDSTRGICVLAATNRREVLDQALVRPGRFDRIVQVKLPDVIGRERILRVHANKLPGFEECKGIDDKRMGSLGVGNAVDLSAVAVITAGMSGAELEFIVNEAAIRAVRRVSANLQQGVEPDKVTPNVRPQDFEASIRNFYDSRKPKNGGMMGEMLSNALRGPRGT